MPGSETCETLLRKMRVLERERDGVIETSTLLVGRLLELADELALSRELLDEQAVVREEGGDATYWYFHQRVVAIDRLLEGVDAR